MTGGVVVVIGQTGRNFAAGMSGGIAYVLDEDGAFPTRCNLAQVELEHVKAEKIAPGENGGLAEVMADLRGQDAPRLRRLIERHRHYTNSARAKHILDNWDDYVTKFVKVMPVDYRRALNDLAAARSAGATQSQDAVHG